METLDLITMTPFITNHGDNFMLVILSMLGIGDNYAVLIRGYLLPALFLFLVFVFLKVGFIVIMLRNSPISSRQMWGGCVLKVCIMIAVLINLFPGSSHVESLLTNTIRCEEAGTVNNMKYTDQRPVYYDYTAKKMTSVSYITTSKTDYDIPAQKGRQVAPNSRRRLFSELNPVMQCEAVPAETTITSQLHSKTVDSKLKNTSIYISVEKLIALLGWTVIAMLFFSESILKLTLKHIYSKESTQKNAVLPRKISGATCLTEILITTFFCLSWTTYNFLLIAFLGTLTGIFWLVQLSIQKTAI